MASESKPLVSVITPASRGIKELTQLFRDFKNQTFADFEHVVCWDGTVPADVQEFMKGHEKDYNIKFCSIRKDMGDIKIAPGTKPRNYGLSVATGKFVVFCDDDDRFRSTYLETLITGMRENTISVVQMSCQESRMFRDGDPKRIRLIPEVGLKTFPVICHVGTPCVMMPRSWALEDPWRHEPEHDFRFFKRVCEKHRPMILINHGMQVDVDGLVLKGMKNWVSAPPFYRG